VTAVSQSVVRQAPHSRQLSGNLACGAGRTERRAF